MRSDTCDMTTAWFMAVAFEAFACPPPRLRRWLARLTAFPVNAGHCLSVLEWIDTPGRDSDQACSLGRSTPDSRRWWTARRLHRNGARDQDRVP